MSYYSPQIHANSAPSQNTISSQSSFMIRSNSSQSNSSIKSSASDSTSSISQSSYNNTNIQNSTENNNASLSAPLRSEGSTKQTSSPVRNETAEVQHSLHTHTHFNPRKIEVPVLKENPQFLPHTQNNGGESYMSEGTHNITPPSRPPPPRPPTSAQLPQRPPPQRPHSPSATPQET